MQNRNDGETHDRPDPRARRRAEDHADAGPEGAVARALRDRAAALQPPPPREPHRLPHPGAGLRRAEARDDPAAGDPRRAVRQRQRHHPPHPARRQAGRRHPAGPRIPRRRAHRHGAGRRLRMGGPAVPLALRHRPRHHRHPLERLGVLRGSSGRGVRHDEADHPQAPLRGLHPQVHRGGAGAGVQLAARPARGLRGLRRQPALRGLGADPRALRRRRLLRRHAGAPGAEAAARRHRGGAGRRRRGLQDRPAVALADGLLEAGRGVRPRRRHLRLGHPVVQHHDLDGAADAQHPAQLRPVRARGHRRAHPRQDQGVAAEGHVHGRQRAARLRGEGPEARGGRAPTPPIVRSDLRAVRPDRLGDGAGAGAAARGRAAPSAASSSTRATSTSC